MIKIDEPIPQEALAEPYDKFTITFKTIAFKTFITFETS